MKLLIIGSDKIFSIENFYVKYLREAGIEVKLYSAQNDFRDYYYKNTLNKILFRLGLSSIYSAINDEFKKQVNLFNPDVILVFKGMELFPASLEWAKQKGIKLANYNPDNPFVFTGKGSGNQNVTDSIKIFDIHFTYNLEIKKELDENFKSHNYLLPFGFDIENEVYETSAKEEEIVKACFLGNPDKIRAKFITDLADKGVQIDVYGNWWAKFISHPNVALHDPVHGNELWKVLRKYRIQLNLMRIHNENSHNMRSFEIPGIGGIQLAPDTTEHRHFFEHGKDVFLYNSVADCVEKISQVLALSKTEADQVRTAARQTSLLSGHSYKDRALFVKSVLEK